MAKVTDQSSDSHADRDACCPQESNLFIPNNETCFFDDEFDFDELMFGHASLTDALPQFHDATPTASQNRLQLSDHHKPLPSLTLLSSVNHGDLIQSFSGSHRQHDIKFEVSKKQSDHRNDMLICDGKMHHENAEVLPRCRDYSLSNDSGVGSCNQSETSSFEVKTSSQPETSEDSLALDELVRVESIFNRVMVRSTLPQHRPTNLQHRPPSPQHIPTTPQHIPTTPQHSTEVDLIQLVSGQTRKPSDDVDVADESGTYGGGVLNFDRHDILSDNKHLSKKTAYNEKWGVKVLKAWCLEIGFATDFEKLNAVQLNEMLCRFWKGVRKSNGDYYGRNSLFNLRAMINKHLKGKPFCATFDIVTDDRFRSSNEELEKQLKLLKGIGRTITHKQPITLDDFRTMYDSHTLCTSNPLALLRKVWFEITLHFCHKGAEAQEKLKKSTFGVFRDGNGLRYIARKTSSGAEDDEARMYETGGELCPVRSFELYLSKLHSLQDRLFQQPRRKSTPESPMWYGKAPIGEKALQQMMANISAAANLSKRYTNHCVRTTALDQFAACKRKGCKSERPSRPSTTSPHVNYRDPALQHPQTYPATYLPTYIDPSTFPASHQRNVYNNSTSDGIYCDLPARLCNAAQQEATDDNVYHVENTRKRTFVSETPNYVPSAYSGSGASAYSASGASTSVLPKRGRSSQSNLQLNIFPLAEKQSGQYLDVLNGKSGFDTNLKNYKDINGPGSNIISDAGRSFLSPISFSTALDDSKVLAATAAPNHSLTDATKLAPLQQPRQSLMIPAVYTERSYRGHTEVIQRSCNERLYSVPCLPPIKIEGKEKLEISSDAFNVKS